MPNVLFLPKWQFFAFSLAYVKKMLYLCSVNGKHDSKYQRKTIKSIQLCGKIISFWQRSAAQ